MSAGGPPAPAPADGPLLAIHARGGPAGRPWGFAERWVAHCEATGVRYRLVDGLASDVMAQLRGCDGFLWFFDHEEADDMLAARSVLAAAEYMGLAVFPDRHTCWHFDDKVAQKYLLEAVGAPLARTEVFYRKADALAWLARQELPVVRKLRAGAGSANVALVRTLAEGRAFVGRMFGRGFTPVAGYFQDVGVRVASARRTRGELLAKARRAPAAVLRKLRKRAAARRERGYAYFQEFAPRNAFDTRVTVVGDRAWAFVRHVRPNDFRASGSRNVDVDQALVDPECVRIAFRVAAAIRSQSTAFDFVRMPDGTPRLVEISYGYVSSIVHSVPGQYGPDLAWHPGHRWPEDQQIDDLVARIRARRARGGAPAGAEAA